MGTSVIQRDVEVTKGTIRLVNPWRGQVLAAVMGNLRASTDDFGATFEIRVVVDGHDFYPGRAFTRAEVTEWATGPAGRGRRPRTCRPPQRDMFGVIPAQHPDPRRWPWYAIDVGAWRLAAECRPDAVDLSRLCQEALSLDTAEALPPLDHYEVWLLDRETQLPLALAVTALTLDTAKSLVFAARYQHSLPRYRTPATREFEDRVNARIYIPTQAGSRRVAWFICERRYDGSCLVHSADDRVVERPAEWLPIGLLAEPWESERKRHET